MVGHMFSPTAAAATSDSFIFAQYSCLLAPISINSVANTLVQATDPPETIPELGRVISVSGTNARVAEEATQPRIYVPLDTLGRQRPCPGIREAMHFWGMNRAYVARARDTTGGSSDTAFLDSTNGRKRIRDSEHNP